VSEDRIVAAFLDAARDVVLTLDTEHEGRDVVVEYRPAVALAVQRRLGEDPAQAPAVATAQWLADLTVGLTIDGAPAPVGRGGLRLDAMLLLGALAREITEHAAAWSVEERERGGPYLQRAVRAASRPVYAPVRPGKHRKRRR